MKFPGTSITICILFLLTFSAAIAQPVAVPDSWAKLPLAFEPNQGQFDARVKFLGRSPGVRVSLTQQGAVLVLRHSRSERAVLGIEWLPARGLTPRALQPLPGTSNYFQGPDPRAWRTGVRRFAHVQYDDVLPGVDLVWHGNPHQLEYDLVVAAGADPSRIALRLRGARRLQLLPDGDLLVFLDSGIPLRWKKPVLYQETGSARQFVKGTYTLRGKDTIAFRIGAYDHHKKLVIDPVLVYSTYVGGSGLDEANGLAVDSAGNAYIAGLTSSSEFPASFGSYSGIPDDTDAFVAKLNSSGTAPEYVAYLGGTSSDSASGIAVDSAGNAYVAGRTFSSDFPTASPFQASCGACPGNSSAFVAKLNADGTGLVYSTFLGGVQVGVGDPGAFSFGPFGDEAHAIAVDSAGSAYVAGRTTSSDFPVTAGVFQTELHNFDRDNVRDDAFVTKLNPDGQSLAYSTFVGGFFADQATGIAVDSAGQAYATGTSDSNDFPVVNAFQDFRNGAPDALLFKLNADGSALLYSSRLGGSSFEFGEDVAADNSGFAVITGSTFSSNFPLHNAINTDPPVGVNGFVGKFDTRQAGAASLLFSTYLSGNVEVLPFGVTLDNEGSIYLTGWTSSSNFPLVDPLQSEITEFRDVFITKMSADGSQFLFSTFWGAPAFDSGNDIAVEGANVYVAGFTDPPGLPTTEGAYQTTLGGGRDAFVLKIGLNRPPVANAGADAVVACASGAGASVTLDGSASSDPDGDTLTYTWTGPFGTATGVSPTVSLPLGTSTITLVVNDGKVDSARDVVTVVIAIDVMGFDPPLAALVPQGETPPVPDHAFKTGRTLPLKLTLLCGGTPMGSGDVAPPRIVALTRNHDALDLSTLDLDAGMANDSGTLFRASGSQWIYNLSTAGLSAGTYIVTVELPDGRRFDGTFVLR